MGPKKRNTPSQHVKIRRNTSKPALTQGNRIELGQNLVMLSEPDRGALCGLFWRPNLDAFALPQDSGSIDMWHTLLHNTLEHILILSVTDFVRLLLIHGTTSQVRANDDCRS